MGKRFLCCAELEAFDAFIRRNALFLSLILFWGWVSGFPKLCILIPNLIEPAPVFVRPSSLASRAYDYMFKKLAGVRL